MEYDTIDAYIDLRLKGHKELFLAEYEGLEFIYRPLSFYEHDAILALEEIEVDGPEINDAIVRRCVLYPIDNNQLGRWLDNALAGSPDKLAQEILNTSGFDNTEKMLELLEKSRQDANTVPAFMESIICTVYKSLTPHEVYGMTLREQLLLYAKAEIIVKPEMDIAKVINGEVAKENRPPSVPIPEGMQSTEMEDILSPEFADVPDIEDILNKAR